MVDLSGAPKEKFKAICSAVDKLDKVFCYGNSQKKLKGKTQKFGAVPEIFEGIT